MNGSRTNKTVPKDSFQDYDVVEAADPFVKDQSWIDRFGPRLIIKTPEDTKLFSLIRNGRVPYLMSFEDGNRLDSLSKIAS